MPSSRKILGPGLLAAALVLTSCGSSSSDSAPAATTTTASSSTAETTAAGSDTTASDVAKVDANTASVDELTAAFTAAGVSSPDRWAHEVEEYRPYSGTDDWAMLKQELSKYNIDEDTLNKILSTLEVN